MVFKFYFNLGESQGDLDDQMWQEKQTDSAINPSDKSPAHSIADLKKALCEMLDRCNEGDMSPALITKAVYAAQRVKTSSAVATTVVKFYQAAHSTTRPRGRIPVQITGVQRRRDGVSKSSRQISRGRPSIAELRVRNSKKKARSLSQAVKNNTANAKSH
jgi:hypothetical protein